MPWMRDRGGRAFRTGTAVGAPPPTIATLNPASVVADTPTPVTITGTGFTPLSVVKVDGTVYPTGAYVSPTTMTFEALASAAGSQRVTVQTGTKSSAPSVLTVT